MSQEEDSKETPAAQAKAWVPEELLSLRTSGRSQSEGIKPELGG